MKGFDLFLQRVLFVLLEIEHQGDALVPLPDNGGVEFAQVVEGSFHGLIARRLDLRFEGSSPGRDVLGRPGVGVGVGSRLWTH